MLISKELRQRLEKITFFKVLSTKRSGPLKLEYSILVTRSDNYHLCETIISEKILMNKTKLRIVFLDLVYPSVKLANRLKLLFIN